MGQHPESTVDFIRAQAAASEIHDQAGRESNGDTPDELRKSRHKKIRYGDLGGVSFARAGTTVETALRTASTRRVFILGKAPETAVVLGQVAALPGARIYLDGHYPNVAWRRSGVSYRLSYAESWFGPGDYTTEDCIAVWRDLQRAIRQAWKDDTAALLMTPATTGRDLWQRTIPADGWPLMSDHWQQRVRSVSGQGRIETFPGPALTSGPIHEYDARIAYCAVTRGLPLGDPEVIGDGWQHRQSDLAKRVAKLHVTWQAPDGWAHPGILPEALPRTGAWHWPLTGEGVVDAVALALALHHGWRVKINGGWYWPNTGDPLRTWQTRLLRIRDMADGAGVRTDMWRHACRATIIYAIGAMHGTPHRVTHTGTADEIHENAQMVRDAGGGRYVWFTNEPAAWPELSHPEWTSTIWERARVRLLDAPRKGRTPGRCGALHMPPGQLIAMRTDALYTDGPVDMGDDDGQPGRYRIKGVWPQGPRPRSGSDIIAMKGRDDDR